MKPHERERAALRLLGREQVSRPPSAGLARRHGLATKTVGGPQAADIDRIIRHYYPRRALISPLHEPGVRWDYDTDYTTLKKIHAELKALDPDFRLGVRSPYDISEEVVIGDAIHVQLSYLGPYAAVNYGLPRSFRNGPSGLLDATLGVLSDSAIRVLSDAELEEPTQAISFGMDDGQSATVFDCLFLLPGWKGNA